MVAVTLRCPARRRKQGQRELAPRLKMSLDDTAWTADTFWPMLTIPAYLDKSPVHGIGVYSKDFVPAGAKVWERHPIFDIFIDRETFEQLPEYAKREVEIHMYEPDANGPYYYETTQGKYMNHSRQPNVDFSEIGVGYATRDIQPGDELTCDYRQIMHDCSGIPYI